MSKRCLNPIIVLPVVLVASWRRIPRPERANDTWNTNRIADTVLRELGMIDACLMSCDRNAQEKAHQILNRTESSARECTAINALGGPLRKKEKPHGVNAPTILLRHALSNIALSNPTARTILAVTESRPRLERIYRDLTQCSYPEAPHLDYGDILIARFRREERSFHTFMDIRHVNDVPQRILKQEVLTSAPP